MSSCCDAYIIASRREGKTAPYRALPRFTRGPCTHDYVIRNAHKASTTSSGLVCLSLLLITVETAMIQLHIVSRRARSRLLPVRRPAPAPVASLILGGDVRASSSRASIGLFKLVLWHVPPGKKGHEHERGIPDTSNGTSPRRRVHSTEAGRSFGRTAPTCPGPPFGVDRRSSTYSRRTDGGFPCPRASSPAFAGPGTEAEADVPATTRAQACVSLRRFGCWASR